MSDRLPAFLQAPLARLRAYAASDDPRMAAANLIALVVAGNQPFYPLYIYWMVGPAFQPALLTFLSTPFFLAIPAIGRRSPAIGKAMLPIVGLANMALAAKAFGTPSGVELFLFPCLTLGALLFRPAERARTVLVTLLAAFLYFGLHERYGAPLHSYEPAEYAAFLRLNALSVATLMLFIGLVFSGPPPDGRPSGDRRDEAPGDRKADRGRDRAQDRSPDEVGQRQDG